MDNSQKNVRVTIYLPQNEYRLLRSKLILEGISSSGWFSKQVKKFLKENSLPNTE